MKNLILLTALLLIVTSACTGSKDSGHTHRETNSVYYWKTVFNPDSSEFAFISRHNVGRIYLRMFDVIENDSYSLNERAIPNATLSFDCPRDYYLKDTFANVEFVPVVYITLEALKAMKNHEGTLASNIVTRVRNMCEYNELPPVHELQLDCDWTTSTEASFFSLCDSARQSISDLELPWRLSSTIRLHQLSHKAPPVDYGVLMVYNTGNFNDPDAANSIIDIRDVEPYLKHLDRYPLHLDIALPTYSWQLLFHRRTFSGLLNGLNLSDTTKYYKSEDNRFIAKKDFPFKNRIIRAGDIVRQEQSSFSDIAGVKRQIEKHLSGRSHSVILYHLDSKKLSEYSSDEINQIFAVGN